MRIGELSQDYLAFYLNESSILNMNSATTTALLLLSQRVDSLEASFGWVIGGLSIALTFLITFYVAIQYYQIVKLQKQEIDALKNELKSHLELVLDEKALGLKSFVDESIHQAENKLEESQQEYRAENARLFALSATTNKLHSPGFYWWLQTAYRNKIIGNKTDKIAGWIRNAKQHLEKTEKGSSFLVERSKEVQEIFVSFENEYPIEISEIKKVYTEKIS